MGKYNGMKSIMKGEQNPQGRPRVYFCAHPDDYDKYLQDTAEEIQGIYRETVVWYLGAGDRDFDDEDRENFEADLKHMQLFVIPITSKLLYGECYAKDEFRFAEENHIPFLPLMKESGLGEDFNRIMGNLQYLDKTAISNDPTALSYEDKFKKYIESVLVGNDLAEKIRASFKAYIFLSYRKKDRKYAQEIMHLIHENDFARDIAIWYDEFLTPGENFNAAIAEAFKKSNLFALVVTPSLLEIPNYVMTTEYPMAKKAGASILPIEAVDTDRTTLKGSYDGIPDTVRTDNPIAVSEALKCIIEAAISPENGNDPKHVFFMGLAYLAGIDVEVNIFRALELITYAAEHGVEDAYKKLVSMYETGEGVARNYDTAADWQMRYAQWAETQWKAGKKDANFVIWRYFDAGDMYATADNFSKAEEAFTRMSVLATEAAEKAETAKSLRAKGVSYIRLGNIAKSLGNYTEAKEYYEKSLEISLELRQKHETPQSLRDLSISYGKLGDIAKALGNYTEAKEYYEKDIEISFEVSEKLGTSESLRDLSISYGKLGDIAKALGNYTEAKEYYAKDIEISLKLSKKLSTPGSLRDLGISYSNLGDIAREQGNLAEAKNNYEKSLEIRLVLCEKFGTPKSLSDLANSYYYLGNVAEEEGNYPIAISFYQQACDNETTAYPNGSDKFFVFHGCLLNAQSAANRTGNAPGVTSNDSDSMN